MRTSLTALLFVLAAALPAAAQGRWKEIGTTSSGNPVSVDPRSVKTVNGIITARVQVKFTKPVSTPQGVWMLSRSIAMFDCAKKTVAAKETIYYGDAAATKVVDKSIVGKPGFGPAIGGSMTQIALDYMCRGH